MNTKLHSLRALPLLALSLVFAPSSAEAQPTDVYAFQHAQALYDQASQEMDKKNYADACPRLEEVTQLIPEGVGAKMTLAQCYEGLGRLASAWSLYTRVEELAKQEGQKDRAWRAARKATSLQPKLATLVIEVPEPLRALPNFTVKRDNILVEDAKWGTAVPIDAGFHEIVVTAAGYRPWRQRLEIAEDGTESRVEVAPLEAEPPPPPPAPPPKPKVMPKPLPPPPPPAPKRPWQTPLGIGTIASGVVGIGIGAVLMSEQDTKIPGGVTTVAGGLVFVGGIAMVISAPSSKKETGQRGKAKPRAHARIELLPTGVQVRGAW